MQRNSNEKVFFPDVLSRLKSNDPKWNMLSISKMIANPVEYEISASGLTVTLSRVHDGELIQLAQALKNNITIETFIFEDVLDTTFMRKWTQDGIKALADALKNHPKLNCIIFKSWRREQLDIFSCLSGSAPIDALHITEIPREFLKIVGLCLRQRNTIKKLFVKCASSDSQGSLSSDFILGIQAQTNLKSFCFSSKLVEESVTELLKCSLSNVASLVELTLPTFSPCHIKSICELLKKNIRLARVDLLLGDLNNETLDDISEVCRALRDLPKLVHLVLPPLSKKSLEYFVNFYKEHNLMISELHIVNEGEEEHDENSIRSVISLIEGNSFLRKLKFGRGELKDSHVAQMNSLLMDPRRCQLESLYLGDGGKFSVETDKTLLSVLNNNEHICDLFIRIPSKEYQFALARNKIIKFVKTIIVLCHVYTSNTCGREQKQTFSSLKPNTFRLILSFLSVEGVDFTDQQKLLCGQVMLNNFTKRRELIDSKQYDPKHPDIKLWWSNSYDGKTLFKKKNDVASVTLLEEKKESTHKSRIA